MNLLEIFAEQVRLRPQTAAIVESRGSSSVVTTFAALAVRAAKIATLLRQAGIRPGDLVLLLQPVSTELYAVLLALFRLGAVAMFLDPGAGRAHFEHCCELLTPRAFIAAPKAHLLRLACQALARIPLKFVFGPHVPGATSLRRAEQLAPLVDSEPCSPDSAALITFTSGSTGLPKAAVRTHGFLRAQHQVLRRHLKLQPGEIDLCTLPIFLLANLASGLTSVVPKGDLRAPGAIAPEPVLNQIVSEKVSRVTASPAFFERLLSADDTARNSLRKLRKIYTGGAPVFTRLLQQLTSAAPEAEVQAIYGSTEAEPIAHLDAHELIDEDRAAMHLGQGLLAGNVVPETRLRIINDQWGQPIGELTPSQFDTLECARGQIGEIVVTGDHVLKGYLDGRGDAETKLRVAGEVWHRTGDAGKIDPKGRLWLLGRCAAKIQDANGLIYPFAVECVASAHPAVRRAALVSHCGKRLLAIEPSGSFTPSTREQLEQSLTWAALSELRVLKRLPVDRRHNAKIDYPTLIRLLQT